mmetsp:Transcript_4414/g.11360  ORF Transcript_4414/g.11360 Transcript_4414/m.11360 type:complete len:258 (+) Transcript_4414:191-964(+)
MDGTLACTQRPVATYQPKSEARKRPVEVSSSVILFIDTQKYNCTRGGALYASSSQASREADLEYFWDTLEKTIPRWKKLQDTCRSQGVEVMYTVIQSLTLDGRDMSLDYKISGFHVPPGCEDAQVLDEISPHGDEIVLPKTSCNVFVSTNIDYILRSLGAKQIILCGCVTDQCVDAAVRSACDLGYLVTMLTDACVTYSQGRHDSAVAALSGFCRQLTTDELIAEIEAQPSVATARSNGVDEREGKEKRARPGSSVN